MPDNCKPNQINSGDYFVFNLLQLKWGHEHSKFRYIYKFKIYEHEWDEGWGWSNPLDPVDSLLRPLPKLLNACYVVEQGIGDSFFDLSFRKDSWSTPDPVSVIDTLGVAQFDSDLRLKPIMFYLEGMNDRVDYTLTISYLLDLSGKELLSI